jgi:hypothetical protein
MVDPALAHRAFSRRLLAAYSGVAEAGSKLAG